MSFQWPIFYGLKSKITLPRKTKCNSTHVTSQTSSGMSRKMICLPNSLCVLFQSQQRSFNVYAATANERTEWMNHINACIKELKQNPRTPNVSTELAPIWQPDSTTNTCQVCRTVQFSLIKRRVRFQSLRYIGKSPECIHFRKERIHAKDR